MVRHGAESVGGPDFPVGQTTGFRSRRDGAARFRPGKNSAGRERDSTKAIRILTQNCGRREPP